MKCQHHPGAPAVGVCDSCQTPICGICANYSGERLLCETCEGTASIEDYVANKNQEANESRVSELLSNAEQAVAQTGEQPTALVQTTNRKEKFQIAAVMLSCVFIVFQIATSLSSGGTLSAEEIAAEEQTRNQIESCMLVFWEIAAQLSAGEEIDASLRCAETELPMTIATVGGDLRISHPRPQSLGLTDIYITRSNPVPILVE